jgi:hypothetical protein
MVAIQINSWQTLPSEGGGSLGFAGDLMAVSGQARLCVWQGETRLAAIDASSPAPGKPRFSDDRVYWGPGFLDLTTSRYTCLRAAQPEVRPGGGERPYVYAWSSGGDRLVGSFSSSETDRPVRVTLFDGQSGNRVATLWEGSGLAPAAAWLGRQAIVVGFGDPRVFDHSGSYLADIALGGGSIAAIEATTDERRLIIVDLNRTVALIDTDTWEILDRWPGPWLHAGVSPDGRFLAALEPGGKLHFACLDGDRFRPAGQAAVDSRAIALAITPGKIATVGGGEVRRGSLEIDCGRASTA